MVMTVTVRIIRILAVAITIGPSLAYGSPACMTESEARAKFPKRHLVLGWHQPLLDIRNSTRTFATLTCGSAGAFPSARTHAKAGAFLPRRSPMPIFAMRIELAQQLWQLGDIHCNPPRLIARAQRASEIDRNAFSFE